MSVLWRGSWATRMRVASGLVLFVYALLHFLNIGLGLISSDAMDQFQQWRQVVTRSMLGSIVLFGAMMIHAGLALSKLAGRRSLRMPVWEASQIALGLIIPLLLIVHIVFTRAAHEVYGVNDKVGYLVALIWGTQSAWNQSLLLLIVWVHGCIGLHFWLRLQNWWQRSVPVMIGFAVLIPGFALAGFLTQGRRMQAAFSDEATRTPLLQTYNWPDAETFAALLSMTDTATKIFWALLLLTALVYLARKLLSGRKSVRISYSDGPVVTSAKGMTLLEISRANGIPHTSLCGGRGRCTTCRVVVESGADMLHPPSETEAKSLKAVGAPPNTRLACQIRPTNPATVFRVFRPDGQRKRAHASQGSERRLAILFLDMRGFTARTTGQLPYDVVFLLNRFFDAVVPSITDAGGVVDKYLGDGLLALFDASDETRSAKAALQAASGIGAALVAFNKTLASEGVPEVRIGMGLHLGDLVLGEIGAVGTTARTIIGDTVNAASRLEGKTKDLGVELLVSESVLISAGIDTRPLDLQTLHLRGVADPMQALAVPGGTNLNDVLGPSPQGA